MTPNKLTHEESLHLVDMTGIEAVRIASAAFPSGQEVAYKLGTLQVTPRMDFPVFRNRPTLTVFIQDPIGWDGAAQRIRAALELTDVNGWY